MAMYETIFILDSLLASEEIDKITDRVKELIGANGGKVLTVDKWGKRRLAYEIQKKQYGFYVALEFEGEGPIPNSLEREYNFNDKVLRFLTYRYTKNKLKARQAEMEKPKIQPTEAEVEKINAPVIREKTAPAIKATAAPVVKKTAAPVVKETAAPVVKETAAPVVNEEAAPAIEETEATEGNEVENA